MSQQHCASYISLRWLCNDLVSGLVLALFFVLVFQVVSVFITLAPSGPECHVCVVVTALWRRLGRSVPVWASESDIVRNLPKQNTVD